MPRYVPLLHADPRSVVHCWSVVDKTLEKGVGPGSAAQREERCTASGTRVS